VPEPSILDPYLGHLEARLAEGCAVLCISRHQSRMEYEVSCPMAAAFG
jgi:hypothetical protein